MNEQKEIGLMYDHIFHPLAPPPLQEKTNQIKKKDKEDNKNLFVVELPAK